MLDVDRMGICCMALGSPWVFVVANQIESEGDPRFLAYLAALGGCWGLMPLFLLAAVGNYPAIMNQDLPFVWWRLLCLLAVGGFAFGYFVFYIGRFHEEGRGRWASLEQPCSLAPDGGSVSVLLCDDHVHRLTFKNSECSQIHNDDYSTARPRLNRANEKD
jgi:hypothetical protein